MSTVKDLRWAGLTQKMSPSLSILSQDQKHILINTAYEMLERTGQRVGSRPEQEDMGNLFFVQTTRPPRVVTGGLLV